MIDFYPRSPCGERLHALLQGHFIVTISIHALLAESDLLLIVRERARVISIHALLAESDCRFSARATRSRKFLSTLSLRRATRGGDSCYLDNIISIHALLAESDWNSHQATVHTWKFLSTLSLRRATIFPPVDTSSVSISIHALLAESDSGAGRLEIVY